MPIGVTRLPYDPTKVTHIPYVWKKSNKDGVISDDLYAAGIALISSKLESFDADSLKFLALFSDRNRSQIHGMLEAMVVLGMIEVVKDDHLPTLRVYAIKPEFIYDPETGLGRGIEPDADDSPYVNSWLEIKKAWLSLLMKENISVEAYLLATESIDHARMTGWHVTRREIEHALGSYIAVDAIISELSGLGLCYWYQGERDITYVFFSGEDDWSKTA